MLFCGNIKNEKDIESITRIKNLACIPHRENSPDGFANISNTCFRAFEKFRLNMQFIDPDKEKTFLITGIGKTVGSSFVASRLASSFAGIGKKVILVDANMENGELSKIFNMPNNIGLSNYILGLDENGIELKGEADRFIHETDVKNLSLITAGTKSLNPELLYNSPKLVKLIEYLKMYFEIIIFDSASILTNKETTPLLKLLQNVVLVVGYGKTSKCDVKKACNEIKLNQGKLYGSCINFIPSSTGTREKSNQKGNLVVLSLLKKIKNFIYSFFKKLIDFIKSKRKLLLTDGEAYYDEEIPIKESDNEVPYEDDIGIEEYSQKDDIEYEKIQEQQKMEKNIKKHHKKKFANTQKIKNNDEEKNIVKDDKIENEENIKQSEKEINKSEEIKEEKIETSSEKIIEEKMPENDNINYEYDTEDLYPKTKNTKLF